MAITSEREHKQSSNFEKEAAQLKLANRDYEERLEQQQAIKENLRTKVKSLESTCSELAAEKKQAVKEMQQSVAEVVQFRQDVDFLTKETSQLIDELQAEQAARSKSEARLVEEKQTVSTIIIEHEDLKKHY